MKRIRVLIADDHPIVLLGLRHVLGQDADYELVGEAAHARQLLDMMREHHPDVVITDYDMPGDTVRGDGLRLIDYLVRSFPATKIVVLTVVSSPVILSRLYELGVSGVLSKIGDMGEIRSALHIIRSGRIYRREQPLGPAPEVESRTAAERISQLSSKELEVLRHLMSGLSVTTTAEALKRSVKTISAQKISAMHKLGVNTDHELVMFCVQHKMFVTGAPG